jgi:hypothetical protein
MRCTLVSTLVSPVPLGRTKRVRMGCFVFRKASRCVLWHSTNPDLLHHVEYDTIVFLEDQKNVKKIDACTQRRSGHKFLCPVLFHWGSAIQRIIATIPDWNEQMTLCSVALEGETLDIGHAFETRPSPYPTRFPSPCLPLPPRT